MTINPKLLKKLSDPQLVAAAGRRAILREEYNSLRNEIRSAVAAILNNPASEHTAAYCTTIHDLLYEFQELAQLMLTDEAYSKSTKED